MRTTLTIDDGVFAKLRRRAQRSGRQLSEVVNEVLISALADEGARAQEPRPPFALVTAPGTLAPGMTWDRLRDLADEEDRERLGLRRT